MAVPDLEHPAVRRGRAARQSERLARTLDTLPYLTRKLPPVEVISTEGLEQIEANADTLLEQVGIEIVNFPEATEIFRGAGADIEGQRVRFPRGMCRSLVQATAPRIFTQRARNPARSVQIGDPYMVLVPTYGSPFIHNLDEGRRYATIEDFRNFVKLTYTSRTLHHGGGTLCEPVDLPVNKRHFEMVYSHIRYSDRAFMGSVTHPSRAQDSVDMARIVFGAETMENEHVIMGLANANSPMSWDFNMLGSAKVYAENNQIMLDHPVHPRWRDGPGDRRRPGDPDARRGAGRDGVLPDRPTRRAGHLRLVRVVDVDAVGRADVRDAGAAARAVRAGRPRPPARRPVPERRQLHGLQAARLPGGLRERDQLPGDDAGRRQLQPAHRRLARGRPRHRLREVHPRRGPGVDDRGLHQRRRHHRQRLRARRDARRRARASTSSARRTRWPTSRTPSGAPRSPTTTASSSGRSTAGSMPPSARTCAGSGAWPSTRCRRSTRGSTTSSSNGWTGARRASRTRTSSRRETPDRSGRRRDPGEARASGGTVDSGSAAVAAASHGLGCDLA